MRDNTNMSSSEPTLKIISFRLGDQVFCLDIMVVREIRVWVKATPLPHSPDYVLGFINLRGRVIPVVDMALRLGLPAVQPTEQSAIIVIDEGERGVGILVESVSDMVSVKPEEMQPVPDVMSDEEKALTKGIVPVGDDMICFLDLKGLFDSVDDVEEAAVEAAAAA
ncbi:chemotaxis protein CheW [Oricola nitratireducens]|jgi:purine-binding chemotaxis protein CheW|uniref:chemotaxis protein CheW n=1 Tax=Oricola nitratireducens TaxID=2775868 RepID=UPI001867DDA8